MGAAMDDETQILARVAASPGRRWLGVLSLAMLGVLLIWVAMAQPPAPGWQIFLLGFGAASLLLAQRMWQATANSIELTRSELRDSRGIVIARVEDIAAIDRGMFAFKPSNGFLVKTRQTVGARSWQPGLWWRSGTRIGIGGVTPGHQTKPMSEILSALLAERDGH